MSTPHFLSYSSAPLARNATYGRRQSERNRSGCDAFATDGVFTKTPVTRGRRSGTLPSYGDAAWVARVEVSLTGRGRCRQPPRKTSPNTIMKERQTLHRDGRECLYRLPAFQDVAGRRAFAEVLEQ